MSCPYETNETMQMLGLQQCAEVLTNECLSKIKDVAAARPHSVTQDTAIDIFLLGVIRGKQMERERRKRMV